MKKGIFRFSHTLAGTSIGVTMLLGCSEERANGEESTGVLLQMLVPDGGTDVTEVRYTIQPVSCKSGAAIGDPIVITRPLEDQTIPGNIPELQDNPLDSGSEHAFADAFKVLPPGCYNVAAVPFAGGKPSRDCAPAFKERVVVTKGQTNELFLISQCKGKDPGALDAIVTLNHEPVLEDVIFTDSKFACGSTEVCVEASDPDNDPIEIVLEAPECVVTPSGEAAPNRQCWEVSCEPGRADLTARVYDQLWVEGSLVRIEDFLAAQGYPHESHAELDFFAYFDDSEECAPRFECTTDIFLSSRTGTATELLSMPPAPPFPITPISSTTTFGYDAIGFNHLDGFIYGISNFNDPPSQPRLVRIDSLGNITDLGVLPGLENQEWVVGEFIEDGTYVIGAFASSEWRKIDVSVPAVIESGILEAPPGTPRFAPLAWAAHPTNGLIYGYLIYESVNGSFVGESLLSTFNPATNEFSIYPEPLTYDDDNDPVTPPVPVPPNPCSSAFLQTGEMLLYCWSQVPPNDVNLLFSVDVAANTAVFITDEELPLAVGDMAACVFPPG